MSAARWRTATPWMLLVVVALLATGLRYGLVEPSTMAQRCGAHGAWWCDARQWLVLGFLHDVYGVLALIASALALLSKRPWLAWLAAALGIFALQLYCYQSGALALLIGSLRLLRLQATSLPPAGQHRQREQHVQAQP